MCANSNSHFHMRAEMADITTTDEASKRRTKKPKKAQQAHLTNESQANSTTKEVPTTVNSHDQSNPSGDESAQLAIDSGDATAGNFSKQSRRKRNSHQRRDLISGSTAATTDAGDSSDDEQFFTPTATPPVELASRIMTEEEEAELDRLRAERSQRGERARRGAFYAGNIFTEKKIGLDPSEEIEDPANSRSGIVSINSSISKSKNSNIKSKSKRLLCGFAETMGRRPSMEDDFVFVGQFRGNANMDLVGLFDGHRGTEAARFAARELSSVVSRNMKHTDDPKQLLRQAFLDLHTAMKGDAIVSGTTALVGLVMQDALYIANAGDSRAVLSVRGVAKRLTTDHRPDCPSEIARITKLGGEITNVVTREGKVVARVKGQLAVSRALGDFDMEPYVTAEPEVVKVELEEEDAHSSFVILACDGVWEVMSDQEAVDIAKYYIENADVEQACKRIRNVAYARGSTDNITVIIIKFLVGDERQAVAPSSKKSWCVVV